ncbi:MAG: glycosyltransferase family 2 protein [Candidatus Margulisiibacteriota bacterium]
MDLSVCIVNYNARTMLENCLRSIIDNANSLIYEIIVVDNASEDGSKEMVRQKYPQVKLMANDRNQGFAKASNQAIKVSSGSYVVLLNNDMVLSNNAFELMVEKLKSDAKIGALTCKIFEKDGKTVQRNCRAFPSLIGTMFGRASLLSRLFPNNPVTRKNLLSDWDYNSPRSVDWVSGACLMVRKEIIDKVGLLDENFFIYWEDTDWCRRIRDKGWEIWFLPQGRMIHFTGSGGGQRSLWVESFTIYHLHRGAFYYFKKHHFKSWINPMAWIAFAGMLSLTAVKISYAALKRILPV